MGASRDLLDREPGRRVPAHGGGSLLLARRGARFGERAVQILARLLLVFGTLLGGGSQPILNLTVELVAVLLVSAMLATPGEQPRYARLAYGVIAAACAVPIVQLLPLPVAFWRMLPGHELPFQIQATAGALGGYHALSLDPQATRSAVLFLLPGVAMFLATLRAEPKERRLLALVASIVAVTSALLGAIQISTEQFYPYASPHVGTSVGVFSNRNHHADLLMVGMLLIGAVARGRSAVGGGRVLWVGLLLLLALCVVTTTSRMGNAMMPFALLGSLALLLGRRGVWTSWQFGFVVAILIIVLLVASGSPLFSSLLDRFGDSVDDERFGFWRDSVVALRAYWPAGSGFGTFVPVFATVENLNAVSERYVNHAHNDYLELLLEGGILAAGALVAYLALLALLAVRAAVATDWPLRCAALGAILVLLVHSAVDYPLRTFTLSTLFGLASALLFGWRDGRSGSGTAAVPLRRVHHGR